MITPPTARRNFNDDVLAFVIGVCEICYQRDMRVHVRCICCATIAGFRAARLYERNVTNDCRGFAVLKSRALRECFQCDARIDCGRRLGAILKGIEYIFPSPGFRASVYSARNGIDRRREKQ